MRRGACLFAGLWPVMQPQDYQVLTSAYEAIEAGRDAWLATVVAVHGSSPRPPGSLALFLPPGAQVGSLSGGCVEEELAASIAAGEFSGEGGELLQYGVSAEENARLGLPCGGHLSVFLERLTKEQDLAWIARVTEALEARRCVRRQASLDGGTLRAGAQEHFEPIVWDGERLQQSFGPRQRMLLVGCGQLAASVAELALALDYDVLVCDPREEARADWRGPAVPVLGGMPDDVVRARANDPSSVVITLTHDPRIDDMALMEALESDAWYVGALGSRRTSAERRERLALLGLADSALDRLHAPVGLDIGSKTPPEIAVAILAELTRLRRRGL